MTTQTRRGARPLRTLKRIAGAVVPLVGVRLRHTALQHPRRVALLFALVAAAAVAGGAVAVLFAIFAALLIVDAVVPIPGATWSEADDRFWRVVRERAQARRRRRLRGLPPERLDVLDEGAGWVPTAQRRALGVQRIALDSVTGTVEQSKANAFDRCFRPDRAALPRWKQLWMVCARGVELPPVAVYRVGDDHIVRDGHHRISVARDLDWATIDADVVELRRTRAD